jgi:hypothetical protein
MKVKEAQTMAERVHLDRKTLIDYLRHDVPEHVLNKAATDAGLPRFGIKLAYYRSDISTAMLVKVTSNL